MPEKQSLTRTLDPNLHYRTRDIPSIRRVLLVSMVFNFAATAIKLSVGLLTGALSIIADALDSLFDGLSNIVGLAGLQAASRPPDADHPYGYRKFETLAALSIAFLLFLTSFQLLQTAWEHVRNPVTPKINFLTVAGLLSSMLIQLATSIYELRAGRRLKSEILIADALHTRASILVSLSVLGGLGLVYLGYPIADPILAGFVSLMIARIGFDILKETIPALVDKAAISEGEIALIVSGVRGVESFHRIRSRGAPGSSSIDLHIRIAPDRTLLEANAIADEVRRRLLEMETVNDVIVHFEAQRGEMDAADLAAGLRHAAFELGMVVHELEINNVDGELNVNAHVGVDPGLMLGEAHDLMDRFEIDARNRFPSIQQIHTHIELATSEIMSGSRVPSELEEQVKLTARRVIDNIPQLSNPHNIRLRYLNTPDDNYKSDVLDRVLITMHCVTSAETPIEVAHQLATQLERELARELPFTSEISIHLEPSDLHEHS